MPSRFTSTPNHVCIMRLSALGDVCHALPVIRTMQSHWPTTKFTWIIGKTEFQLIGDIADIEFIVFDKSQGLSAYKELRKNLKGRSFDILLHMQTSARSNLAAFFIPAKTKIGYDKLRSREGHSLVINEEISPAPQQHQIDDLFGFAEHLGITEKCLRWDIPIPDTDVQFAQDHLNGQRWLAINACSSPSKRVHRNWPAERYAEVADFAHEKLGINVVLVGGPTDFEKQARDTIFQRAKSPILDLVGKTSLKQLLAILQQSHLLLTSDSGPAHIATAVGTPVIALHAATNPFQTGPYLDFERTINRYPEAILNEYGKSYSQLPWGIRAHSVHAMESINATDVTLAVKQFFSTEPRIFEPTAM